MASLRLLIVSDIHAGHAAATDSYTPVEPPIARLRLNPLSDLVNLAEHIDDKIDYVVVPGDMGNRADASGLAYAWSKLQQLARVLNAPLIAVPGNHDVVTRTPTPDPREQLKKLLPTLPTLDESLNQQFWSLGYCFVEESDHRILLMDSTFDFPKHPGAFSTPAEEDAYLEALNRGGVTAEALQAIEQTLSKATRKLNFLVLHHHPLEHQLREHMRDWYGPMRRGSELMQVLADQRSAGRWLVIHGHKHLPQLVQDVRTTSYGPVVLCAASLGHHLWAPVTSFVRNQFHIVEIADDRIAGVGSFCGVVRTYSWGYSIGWALASRDLLHLPPYTGFGWTGEPGELAAQIDDHMAAESLPIVRRADLLTKFPMIQYLAPMDRRELDGALEALGRELEVDEAGRPEQVSSRSEKAQ